MSSPAGKWPARPTSRGAVDALRAAGVEVALGDAALCAQRCVQQWPRFATRPATATSSSGAFTRHSAHFASPAGVARFITGDIGMGHTVLPAPAFEDTMRLFCDVLGFGLSDMFNFKPAGDGRPEPCRSTSCIATTAATTAWRWPVSRSTAAACI